jgi:hypothetical protein
MPRVKIDEDFDLDDDAPVVFLCYGIIYNQPNHNLQYEQFISLRYTPLALVYVNPDQCILVLEKSWLECQSNYMTLVPTIDERNSFSLGESWALLDWPDLINRLPLLKSIKDQAPRWHVWFRDPTRIES